MDSHFIKTIQRVFRLDEDILNIIYDKIEVLEFPARYKLIKSGTVANKIYLIEKGACRSYYLKDDKEITTWFTFEFDFTTSFYSFISNEPSNETIELLETQLKNHLLATPKSLRSYELPPLILSRTILKREYKI